MKNTIRGAKYPLTVKKKSAISGHGVFAVKAIPWGKKIVQFKGAIIANSEATERAAKGATAIMELDKGRSIDGFDQGNGASWINHQRRLPNCFVLREDDEIWIVSGIEGIEAGEELTYDYGSEYYPRKGRERK